MNANDDLADVRLGEADEEFGRTDGVVERRYDREAVSTSETIVYAVAEAADVDPLDLTPIHESVDTDALDSLFRNADRSTLLSFQYAGYDVSVSGEGRVVVAPTR